MLPFKTLLVEGGKIKILFALFLFLSLLVGMGLQPRNADEIYKEYQHLRETATPQEIFTNNFKIFLLMLIPVFGIIIGCISFFNAGVVLGVVAVKMQIAPSLVILNLLISPIFWMEFLVYTLAITRGTLLILDLFQHFSKGEKGSNFLRKHFWLMLTLFIFGILLLSFAAVLEFFLLHL